MVTVLLRETNADAPLLHEDVEVEALLLGTLPAACAVAVAIQSPAMAAVEGAAEATCAVFEKRFCLFRSEEKEVEVF